jgi:uncharacterized protein (UPF0332 family)
VNPYVEMARLRMEASKEALSEARIMAENEKWRGCTRCLYYACFYGAAAILALDGKESKKHSGIESMFLVDYIHSGIIPKELGRFYSRLFKARLASDYVIQEPLPIEKLPEWLELAEALILDIEKRIEERTNVS